MYMRVQAVTEVGDEGDRAQVQTGRVNQSSTRIMGLQTRLHHPQESTQGRIERALQVGTNVLAIARGLMTDPTTLLVAGE